MIGKFLLQNGIEEDPPHKEGELFKTIELRGEIFEIRYGYYEESDRACAMAEPMPIYPDLIGHPRYTDTGFPFVTMMQDVCEHYDGVASEDGDCSMCKHFERGEELLGICTCEQKRKKV